MRNLRSPKFLLFDEKDAARLMAVSVAALRRWRLERRGPPFVRIERCVRYCMFDLLDYLDKNTKRKKKK